MSGGPYSRALPFPWDIQLQVGSDPFVGLMLTPGQDGLLVGKKEQSLANVVPSVYGVSAAPPDVEAEFALAHLVGGMGEVRSESAVSTRYFDAIGVDCSVGGRPQSGPLFAAETLPAALAGDTSVTQFLRGPGDPNEALYCLRGRGVYRNATGLPGGVWTLSLDLGALVYANQAVVYQGTAGPRYLLVANAWGNLMSTIDGTTWALAGPGAGLAQWIEVVGRELWVGAGAFVYVCVAGDPTVAGSWGGAIQIGALSTRITYLKAVDGRMFIGKEDGLYSTTTTDVGGTPTVLDNDLFPELRNDPRSTNFRNAAVGRDALWFPFGSAFYSMTGDAVLDPIGPERLVDYHGEVRGQSVTSAWFGDTFLYHGVYSSDTGSSYLLKFGTWSPADSSSATVDRWDGVWHGAVAVWPLKRITRMDVIHDAAALPTLYVGFSDGSVQSTPLPGLGSPDPTTDPRCRFVATGRLTWPLQHGGFGGDTKSYHAFQALGPRLTATQTVRQLYRVDPLTAYLDVGVLFTQNGQRQELPDATTGLVFDAATELNTSNPAVACVLDAMILHWARRAAMRLEWSCTVDARNNIVRHDGIVSRRSATAIRNLIRAAAGDPAHVRVRLPEGIIGSLAQVGYQESLLPFDRRRGLEWSIGCSFVQFKP